MENSIAQSGIEGVYEQIDVICTMRPVYRQIWPNFIDVHYLFYSWAFSEWFIGDAYENCNETNGEFQVGVRVKDGFSSPCKVTQPWSSYVTEEDRWEVNEELTVISDGEFRNM